MKAAYEQKLANRGNTVKVLDPNGEYEGVALGINDKGELLVRKEDGIVEAVYAGEVSVRGLWGYV
jgi:BirA family biotin operon repressor/biotin-[acetyl-CoA-carboxylase] ligase